MNMPHVLALPAAIFATAAVVAWLRPVWIIWRVGQDQMREQPPSGLPYRESDELSAKASSVMVWSGFAAAMTALAIAFAGSSTIVDMIIRFAH